MEQFFSEYPGEVKSDWDRQIYLSVIESEEDAALALKNMRAWKGSDKWKRGFIPTAENYLKKRQWKDPPPASVIPDRPKEYPKVMI